VKQKVSIIVPNYNHAPYLQQRLDSVFNQTFKDFEVILLDDASTDGSQALLKDYKSHPKVSHLIFNETNSGSPFRQWQKGIALAQGDYIWIAESDDYCELTFLETLISNLEENIGLCYAQTIDVDVNGNNILNRLDYTKEFIPNIWKHDFKMDGLEFIKNYLLAKNVVPNASAIIFKRSLLNENIFSNELLEMSMCGDWLFWIKLCEHTQIQFVSKPLNYFRTHQAISRQHSTVAQKRQRLMEERIIRSYVYTNLKFHNTIEEEKLYQKWFKLHSKRDAIGRSFNAIRMPQTTKFKFLKLYLKTKR
jgi:glycosyltransferase involved in cell wall biosynthesis